MSDGAQADFYRDPPWKVYHDEKTNMWFVVTDRGDPREEYDVFEDGKEPHCRLAAAAPEMLRTLKFLRSIVDNEKDEGGVGRVIDDAIALAEGTKK